MTAPEFNLRIKAAQVEQDKALLRFRNVEGSTDALKNPAGKNLVLANLAADVAAAAEMLAATMAAGTNEILPQVEAQFAQAEHLVTSWRALAAKLPAAQKAAQDWKQVAANLS